MTTINWMEEVLKRKGELLKDTQSFLQIKSVLEEETASETAPFGEGIEEALQYLLKKGEIDGFTVKNVDHYAGHIELGQGEDIVGVLCHVDVVPEGDGWTSDPYSAEIRDGKIFARGAMDDKGPTMAAYYALKIVKELDLPLSKRVRIIIGTDEESSWKCVDHYFKHEAMPTLGFAPDADFPIIYAEKGIGDIQLSFKPVQTGSKEEGTTLLSFSSGRRLNMVPDMATATVQESGELSGLSSAFQAYLDKVELEGGYVKEGNAITFNFKGVSAHAMEPNNGVNAGYHLATFLSEQELDQNGKNFVQFVTDKLAFDSRGEKLDINFTDDITGDLTINTGIFSYSVENGGKLGVNIRFPVTCDTDEVKQKLVESSAKYGMEVTKYAVSKAHHVPQDHPLIQTLQKVYEDQTGEKAELLSIGGGTYARSLEAGVAFGPLFPGRADVAHQKDEHIFVEDLLKATAIYAQAIYELAK